MAACVVWCQSCKTAVWAYDQIGGSQDVRGLMNMMGMPCPECGEVGNFDGWNSRGQEVEELIEHLNNDESPVYDWWSVLKTIFQMNCKEGVWAISPDCRWFNRPENENYGDFPQDTTAELSELIKERYKERLSLEALETCIERE